MFVPVFEWNIPIERMGKECFSDSVYGDFVDV